MSEFIDAIIAAALSIYGLAIGGGLIAAWSGVQAAKKHWGFGGRKAVVLALVLGFVPSYLLWPGWGAAPIAIGLCVGLAAPCSYKILIALIRRRWPEIAAEMSGDRKQ